MSRAIEVKLADHMLDKTFRSDSGGREVAILVSTLKPEIVEWLAKRLNRRVENYWTGDEHGNWYYAIEFRPEESTIAVEFKITWS
jgi:hypothetical protein